MIKCTCIDKFRDNSGNIKGYRLQDAQGNIQDIDSNELKNAIRAKQISVDNLTLTSDNRLLSKTAESVDNNRLSKLRERCKESKLGNKYQKLFEPMGIDVVTAKYLAYPKEGDDINSIYRRTFGRDDLGDIRELVVDPSPIIGYFSGEYGVRYRDSRDGDKNVDKKSGDSILMGGETESSVIILVLHKDGGFRTVVFSEVNHVSNLSNIAQGMADSISRREGDLKYSLSVITLDRDKKPDVTNVGKSISNRERGILVEKILASTIDLWVGQEATKNILNKIDKKQAAIKLKRIGIGTLGIPFAAVALVGVAGVSVVAGTIQEISEMSLDERIVFGNHGFIGVNAYRKLKGDK